MGRSPFSVTPYSISALKKLLTEKSGALPTTVNQKLHTHYFEQYFDHLNAATILCENDYVDRDFMEDYAGFYARCFGNYSRTCARLHFFTIAFSSRQFTDLLTNKSKALSLNNLNEAYLGFVVVKKLPSTFIGRTCLKTYDDDNGRRLYLSLRSYEVGLYGLKLVVKDTLGFQEQDRGAAACATSALWVVFQATGKLFQHAIPSPVEITKMATQIPDEAVPGAFPSRGLTGRQEIHAIRQIGMEVDCTYAQNEFNFCGTAYAYLKSHLPLLLNVSLYDTSFKPLPKEMDWHAIALTGYSLGHAQPKPYGIGKFCLRASRIDKFYVHDDQVGPFARMLLDGIKVSTILDGNKVDFSSLSSSWIGRDGRIGSVRAVPQFIIVPLYQKVRIRFDFVREMIMGFDAFVCNKLFGSLNFTRSPFEWDIYLTTVNELKYDLRNGNLISGGLIREKLLTTMPRFIWRARACNQNDTFFELLFDATDIEQGELIITGIGYEPNIFSFICQISREAVATSLYDTESYWRILEWFAKQT